MRFEFVTSPLNNIFERRVTSIVDVLSFIGGIYKSLTILGFLFCAAFSYNLFMASLIRKLFHFKPKFPNESPKKKNKRKSTYKPRIKGNG